jgi:hypothetical protein
MARKHQMTEELWLKSRDLKRLFAQLGKPTKLVQDPRVRRRYRLFGVAAITHSCRELKLPDIVHQALDVAERFADNHATAAELELARAEIQRNPSLYPLDLALCCVTHDYAVSAGYDAANYAPTNSVSGNQWEAHVANSIAHSHLFRDIFGNPFRSVTFDPEWRTSTAVALAQQMYDSRDFSAMPILADSLQDAGCENADVLDHCRGPGPHVRGCWVVDLVLGKS